MSHESSLDRERAGSSGSVLAERVRALFAELCERPRAEQVAAVRTAAAQEPEVAAEVASLLRCDAGEGARAGALEEEVARLRDGFLRELGAAGAGGGSSPAAGSAPAPAATSAVASSCALLPPSPGPDSGSGARAWPPAIDGFDIEQELGAGSMGRVFRAQQHHPPRRVALKVVASADPGLARRFETEIALLARLGHPGIAQIFTAGTTDAFGAPPRPWCAMELVEGRPLDVHCAERGLDRAARVALVEQVAAAVGYAHDAGVVHRDLKPENVVVAPDGTPKVLDFGIASAVDAALFAARPDTSVLSGTLRYMSPEELTGAGARPDPRADVWALGVLLYELLAGRPPIEPGARPLAAAIEHLARTEPTPLRAVAPDVDRDLATVVSRALARDPAQRYADAGELAHDLGRWSRGEAVRAQPLGFAARTAALAARHRLVLAGLALAGLGLVLATVGHALPAYAALALGLAGTSWSALRARRALAALESARTAVERERARAEHTSATLRSILSSPDPGVAGPETRVVDLLDRAARELGRELRAQPDVEGALRHTLGQSYRALGLGAAAEREFERACLLRARAHGLRHPETLDSMGWHALALRERGAIADALALQRQVVRLRDEVLGPEHSDAFLAHSHLGLTLLHAGSADEALRELEHAHTGLRRTLGDQDPNTAIAATMLASLHLEQARFALAAELLEGALAAHARSHGPEHPETLKQRNNLANALARLGRVDEAEAHYRELAAAHERVFGPAHWATFVSRLNLGQLLGERDPGDEALEHLGVASAGLAQALGPEHRMSVVARAHYGELLRRAGRPAAAQVELEATHAVADRALAPSDPRRWDVERNLGRALVDLGLTARGLHHLRRALRGYERAGSGERAALVRQLLGELEIEGLAAPPTAAGEPEP